MKNIKTRPSQGRQNVLSRALKQLVSKIRSFFEPQEVEVIFKVEGNKMRYTYTRVAERKVA